MIVTDLPQIKNVNENYPVFQMFSVNKSTC